MKGIYHPNVHLPANCSFSLFTGQICGHRQVRPEDKIMIIAIHPKLRFLHFYTQPQGLQQVVDYQQPGRFSNSL